MNEKDVFYGQVTSLVDSSYTSDNFFKGLKYKNNFEKQYKLIKDLSEKFEGIDIYKSFDYLSSNKNINTFKLISITRDKTLLKEIKKIKNDYDIKKIIDDENKDCITIIFN